MVAENRVTKNRDRHYPDIGTMGTTGTDRGNSAAPVTSRHQPQAETVPQVPVVPVSRGVPVMFQRFASSPPIESEPTDASELLSASGGGEEPLSRIEEEEPIDDESDDDGPWIINAEAAAELDHLIEVDFDEVPVCSCGRYCDSQTLDDAWHCSHCDSKVAERRENTLRLLHHAKRIRQQNI